MMKISKFFTAVQQSLPTTLRQKKYETDGISASMNNIYEVINNYFSKNKSNLEGMVDEVYKIAYNKKYRLTGKDINSIAIWATISIFQRIKDSECAKKKANLMLLVNYWFAFMQDKKNEGPFLSCVSVENVNDTIGRISFDFKIDADVAENTAGNKYFAPANCFYLSVPNAVDGNSDAIVLIEAYFWSLLSTMGAQKGQWLLPFTEAEGVENSLLDHFTSDFAREETPVLREKMQKLLRSILEGKLVVRGKGDVSDAIATYIIDELGLQSDSSDEQRKMVNLFLTRANEYIYKHKNSFSCEIDIFAGRMLLHKVRVKRLLDSVEEEREVLKSRTSNSLENMRSREMHMIQIRVRELTLQLYELKNIATSLEKLEDNAKEIKKFLGRITKDAVVVLAKYKAPLSVNAKEKISHSTNIGTIVNGQVSRSFSQREEVCLACIDKLKPIIDVALSKTGFDVDSIYKQVTDMVSNDNSELEGDDQYAIATWAAIRIFSGINKLDGNRSGKKALNLMKLMNAWISFMSRKSFKNKLFSYFSIKEGASSFQVLFNLRGGDDVKFKRDERSKEIIFTEKFTLLKLNSNNLDVMSAAQMSFFHLLRMITREDYQCLSPFIAFADTRNELFESFSKTFCKKESKSSAEKMKRLFKAIWDGIFVVGEDDYDPLSSPSLIFKRVEAHIGFAKYESIEERYNKVNESFEKICDYISRNKYIALKMIERVGGDIAKHMVSVSALLDEQLSDDGHLNNQMGQQAVEELLRKMEKFFLKKREDSRINQEEWDQLHAIFLALKLIQDHVKEAQKNLNQAINNVNFVKDQCRLHMVKERARHTQHVNVNKSETTESAKEEKNPVLAFLQRIWRSIWNWLSDIFDDE